MRFEGKGAWKRATGELVVVRLSAVYFALVALPSSSFVQGPPSIDNSFVNVYDVGDTSFRVKRPLKDFPPSSPEFKKRGAGKGPEGNFNKQITAIQRAGYPASLDCVIVPALSSNGVFLDQRQIENIVFPPITSAHV
jgi:hypothetical protein